MAVSKKALATLLRHGENDNVPWRAVSRPEPQRPSTGPAELDIDYRFLAVRLDAAAGVLWAEMRHTERACYTPGLMRDMRAFQTLLRERYSGRSADEMPFRWLVWTSQAPKVWSLGGDLTSFTRMIRAGDIAGLRAYAHLAIDILHDNLVSLDLPILTVALIRGDAIGGGFEAMLTDDVVIAEEGARFGLPEILFNLFPGMGGYSFLKRKVGPQLARTLLEDGITRSAAEAKALGLVDRVCPAGEAEHALRAFLAENDPRFATMLTLKRVRDRVDPVTRRELIDVVDMWVELAMGLGEAELRRMDCLARVQERRRAAA
jgi:DSF synthase